VAASTTLNPEQRSARASKAHLAGAVNAVVAKAPQLTEEQITRLRALFCDVRQN
jgi:hypothetical protein